MADEDCRRQQDIMLTEEDIAAFLDGVEQVQDKTRRHMAQCSYCRELIQFLKMAPRPEQVRRLRAWHCPRRDSSG